MASTLGATKYTSAMLKSLWKDPVWAAVIATSITAAAGALGTYLLGLWPAIATLVVSGWMLLLAQTSVSNWVLVLLAVSGLPALLLVLALAWSLLPNSSANQTSWENYRTDAFFGLRWRWRYVGGAIDRLNTFCPHCDYQVYPQRASAYQAIDRIAFQCDSCERQLGTFDESFANLESKAERFIQQKLRNDSWQAKSGA